MPPDFSLDHPLIAALGVWDALAVALLLTVWNGANWWIERGPHSARSMSAIMDRRRADWMRSMVTRENRVFDSSLLASLQNGAAFFASATLLAIGGVMALLADPTRLARLANDLPLAPTEIDASVWEAKLMLLLAMAVIAFLKFAWCARLFSYCAVLMGATPIATDDASAATAERLAAQAAVVNRQAARSFDRGLRTLYFTLAALAWLAGPLACILATALVTRLIHRREFLSVSRAAVAGES